MIGGGVTFFDMPTVYMAKGEIFLEALTQYAETHPHTAIVVRPKLGGYFARAVEDAENKDFRAFLREKFDGSVTFYEAHPFSSQLMTPE